MSGLVSYMIGIIETDGKQGWAFLFDVCFCHCAQSFGVFVVIGGLCMVAQGKRVYQIFNSVPFDRQPISALGCASRNSWKIVGKMPC